MAPYSSPIATYLIVISCLNAIMTTDATRGNNGKNQLDDIVFRVSAFEYLPFMMSQRGARGNVTYSGISVDILELMIQFLQLRIVYVPVNPAEVNKYGLGVALIHQLQKDEVDYAPFPFLYILEYSYQVDLCYPFTVDDFILMQPYPKEVSRLSAPLTPFTKDVWLFFILSIVVFTIIMTIVIFTRNRENMSQKNKATIREQIYKRFEYVLTIITSQGNVTPQEVKRFFFRLMLALWLLSMVVLINAYIGTYTANMAVPKLERTINTLEELAASKKFKMTIELNSDLSYKALSADSGSYKNLGDSFRKHPELLFTNPLDAILNVAKKDCVYPGSVNIVNYYINEDLKAYGECRMTIATKPLMYFVPLTSALQKGSPYTEIYNREFMLRVWENGIISRLRRQYFPPMSRRCQPWGQGKVENTPLKLKEFYGIFVLFLGGCISSLITFLAELLVAKINKNKN